MKKIQKIKLSDLSKVEMSDRELSLLRGGSGDSPCECMCTATCSCTCEKVGDLGAEETYLSTFDTTMDDKAEANQNVDADQVERGSAGIS